MDTPITIVPLQRGRHDLAVVTLALESCLEFPPDLTGTDTRLAAWRDGNGSFAAAVVGGKIAAIAAVAERAEGCLDLLWLETRQAQRGLGAGQALLGWAHAQAGERPLRIAATPNSEPFYRRFLPPNGGVVVVA